MSQLLSFKPGGLLASIHNKVILVVSQRKLGELNEIMIGMQGNTSAPMCALPTLHRGAGGMKTCVHLSYVCSLETADS